MERRSFLKKAGAGLAAGAAAGVASSTVSAAPAVHTGLPAIKWRMTSSFPKSVDTLFGSAEMLANRVREITGGKFDIRIHAPGEIVPALMALDAVQQNTVEMCHTCSYYYVGKDKAFGFGTAIPFGLNARQMDAWIIAGNGQQLLDEFYANYNLYSFLGGNTGVQMGGWYRKQISTVDDIKGLKIRIAGLGGEILSRMGAVPQQLGGGDIYTSLEKGTIDAAEWVAPYDDEKLGLYKVAPYYYSPGWWEPGPVVHFFVNRQEWDKLPKEYQAAFRAASREAHILMTSTYDHKNPQALARLLGQGVKLQGFSNEIMKKAYDVSRELYAEEAAKNPAWAKIYADFDKYRKSQNAWFGVAEAGFDRFMQSVR
ncbi:TRAP transporter substrate-binding protein [Thauera chlorobenzoica]|uniref:TRAP transporter solute receptor n=1 Tax=Thauera chlorobenzoica TaxID=96773 RepID=A0A1H5TL93_9RHOO|nr:TRAP transporter substrate-binding protein [Thauera chlorobenzoica]APR06110.1 TRAP transporter solute receptor [Thauera chlorobenzoica]SEF63529.1 Tat (twin-arginine translocation) pathway signal sequence [Thauera chlorobenzoica]